MARLAPQQIRGITITDTVARIAAAAHAMSLGVRVFQRFLRQSGLHGPTVFPRYVAGSGGGATLVAATYGPETAHLLIFVVLGAVATDFTWRGWWDTAGWLSLFNILHNAYPVLSLRYVRVRADRIFRSARP